MGERHDFALTHPLGSPDEPVDPYRVVEPQPDGNLLMSILAVDR